MKGQGRREAQERTHLLAESSLPSLQMILCDLAPWLWVWTPGPLPQLQAAGQGNCSQEHGLFTLPRGPNSLLSPEKVPTAEVWTQTCTIRPSSLGPQTQRTGQDGVGRPGSAWPVGRVEAEPKTKLPHGICRLPETTSETHLEASQPLPSRPPVAPQGLPEPMSLA